MKFSVFEISNSNKFKKIKKTYNSHLPSCAQNEFTLYHYNKLNNNLIHTAFQVPIKHKNIYENKTEASYLYNNIGDFQWFNGYIENDQFPKNQLSNDDSANSFDDLINVFVFLKTSMVLIEKLSNDYLNGVVKFIEDQTDVKFTKLKFDNKDMFNIVNKLDGFIKETVLFDNESEEKIETGPMKLEKLSGLLENLKLMYILIQVGNRYISVEDNGTVSVDNHDEHYLINFTGEIVDGIGLGRDN